MGQVHRRAVTDWVNVGESDWRPTHLSFAESIAVGERQGMPTRTTIYRPRSGLGISGIPSRLDSYRGSRSLVIGSRITLSSPSDYTFPFEIRIPDLINFEQNSDIIYRTYATNGMGDNVVTFETWIELLPRTGFNATTGLQYHDGFIDWDRRYPRLPFGATSTANGALRKIRLRESLLHKGDYQYGIIVLKFHSGGWTSGQGIGVDVFASSWRWTRRHPVAPATNVDLDLTDARNNLDTKKDI